MSSYIEQVRQIIEHIPCNEIFVASELKTRKLMEIPENTYYKSIERLVKDGVIIHLTKGLYYRPEKYKGDNIPISKERIVEYYISNNSGIVVGERMFSQKGIVPQNTDDIKILSSNLKEEKKHIDNIEVQKIDVTLNENTIPVIETMEILQNYNNLQEMNRNRFLTYMRSFTEIYSDESAKYVIENRKYKKSTIAFLERMLTWYGVENSLRQYLSPLSEYKIPTIEELRGSLPTDMKTYLEKYTSELKKIYKDKLEKVILYGSYARGDYTEDSDVDIMILLSISDMEIKNYRELLSELTYDFNTNYDIDIKPIAKNKDEFTKWINAYPFYANIQREGVELFGAA